jgi:hypothetical protein
MTASARIKPLHVSLGELPQAFKSEVFCVLNFYVDESYDDATFCVGGWVHRVDQWKLIEEKLAQRIEYESRRSVKRGLRPVSRFHAADCSNRQNECEGWSVERSKRFYQKIVEISCKHNPHGIAWSCAPSDLKNRFPDYRPKKANNILYFLCLRKCLDEICRIVADEYPNERVTVFHDWGFNGAAQAAFDATRKHNLSSGVLMTIAPIRWQDCTVLQTADLMAYEGAKAAYRHRNNNLQIRRSFQEILGSKVGLSVGYLDEWMFEYAKNAFALKASNGDKLTA